MDKNGKESAFTEGFATPEFHKKILSVRRNAFNYEKQVGSSWKEVKRRITNKHNKGNTNC